MIEEQKHTLGEWGYDRAPQDYDGGGSPAYSTITCGDVVIAQVNDLIPEGAANGHLMAAAPDMLAALEKLDEMRKDFFIPDDELGAIDGNSIGAFVEMYRAAISKAKGGRNE